MSKVDSKMPFMPATHDAPLALSAEEKVGEDVEILTVFYSKHSGNCKALLQYLRANPIKGIKYINIDVPDLRNLAQRKFSVVPALVVLRGDTISLFTGENVFEWFAAFNEQSHPPTPTYAPRNTTPAGPTAHRSALQTRTPDQRPVQTQRGVERPPTIHEVAAQMMKERESQENAQMMKERESQENAQMIQENAGTEGKRGL